MQTVCMNVLCPVTYSDLVGSSMTWRIEEQHESQETQESVPTFAKKWNQIIIY